MKKIFLMTGAMFFAGMLTAQTLSVEQYRNRVLEYNQDIQMSRQAVNSALYSLKSVKTDFFPKLDVNGNYSYQVEEVEFLPGADLKHDNYGIEAGLVQNVYSGSAVRKQYDVGRLQHAIAQLGVEHTIDNIVYAADLSYWAVVANRDLYELSGQYVKLVNEEGLDKALERRADYQTAIMNIEMAKLQTDLARSQFLPQLVVGVKEKYGTTLINVDGKAKWATTAFAQINIPVFHWGKMRQEVRLGRSQEEMRELERSQLKDRVSEELNNGWVNVTETAKKLEIVYSSLDIAKETLILNTFSYNEGKLPILDVLSAQVSWLQAYTNVVSVNYQYKVALAAYAKALGNTGV